MLNKIPQFASQLAFSLIAILLCMGILDFVWLGLVAGDWYQSQMKPFSRSEVITWPWLIFYMLYSGVVLVLAVFANRDKPGFYAAIDGALLGMASYGTYNLTCYSLIDGFSLSLMIVDWSWGTCLTSACAMAGWVGFRGRLQKG